MSILVSRRIRAAVVAAVALAGALAAVAGPATAQCKYGGPHCVNPRPGPKVPTPSKIRIPDSNWTDPDCKYYGNCHR
jgi:hypothetical protein